MSSFDLRVLRRINKRIEPAFAQHLMQLGHIHEGGNGRVYVDNDLPRDREVTDYLMSVTQGFAISDAEFHVLREFKTLAQAEDARATATTKLSALLEGEGEDATEDVDGDADTE